MLTMQSTTLVRRAMWAGAALAIALTIDVVTKWRILNIVMVPPRIIEIAPFFNLTLGFNTGVSFGMFSDLFRELPLLLAGIKVGIAAALLIWALRTEKFIETVGLGLIAGGAGGNIVDRIAQGAVTDFLDFHVGGWHWPTFNMADVTITVGVVLLVGASVWPAPASLRERQRQAMDQR